ncbi:MAG TPA: exo-alpha-sialidase [Thermoguttaceae bacterium]|nr:exo-alpha-sialidase [Thermoguttaceae bacterium]
MPHYLVFVLACVAATPSWNEVQFGEKTLLLHPKCQPLPSSLLGPFVKLADGSVLAVDEGRVMVSGDGGESWEEGKLFGEPEKFACRAERAVVRTRDGTLIVAFMNTKELVFRWDQDKGGPQPGCRLPVYVVRSTDEGQTWGEPILVQEGYCGALRTMIQLRSGRLVLGCQDARKDPGHHICCTYVSDDDGKTWTQSNVIDLGKYGGYGDHGGGIEPTLAELRDGRLWMLIRTYRGCFTEAWSDDEGLTWKDVAPGKIAASGSPGQLKRLHSGRLVLFWNRFIDPEKRSGRREQLSMAFSEDDGRTWTEPAVVAYDPMKPGDKEPEHRLSYPYVYEHVPGELWVTTMQGPLRIKLFEDDFLPRPLSDKTYRIRYLAKAAIGVDGRLDEPDWSKAAVERGFTFPWKEEAAPPTEFRALCDAENFYFGFKVDDADLFTLDEHRDELDGVFEDRAEMYFARDDGMKDYFAVEVDSSGRTLDYRGSYYRQIDFAWNWEGVETSGSKTPTGYVVEGRIPLASFEAMGFPRLRPRVKIRGGLYRAEFRHDRSGRKVEQRETIHNQGRQLDGPPPVEAWMSWIDPKTAEPDFHVPASLGWLEVVE